MLASEWVKLRSLRFTYLTLLFAAVAAVGIGYLVTHSQATHWATNTAQAKASFDPVNDSFTGLGLAQLAFGVIGVLAISSEYTTGLIRTTFAATPRRRAVIAAKAAVVGVLTLAAGELIAFATFLAAQQALSAQHADVTLAHPGALRGVLAAGFYLAVMAWVGLGLGAVIRHTVRRDHRHDRDRLLPAPHPPGPACAVGHQDRQVQPGRGRPAGDRPAPSRRADRRLH